MIRVAERKVQMQMLQLLEEDGARARGSKTNAVRELRVGAPRRALG